MAQPMHKIADLFTYDIHRRIEEVVKVDQANEAVVATELREYVVTEKIRDAYAQLLERYLDTRLKPHEGIGIWISGFFGSGKSSFAKILGYMLQNRAVEGDRATDLFLNRLPGAGSDQIKVLLREINSKIPTDAVIFDVSTDRSAKSGAERLTALMYKALLRDLGYATDFTLAELEINLEADGKLAEFQERFQASIGRGWSQRRIQIAFAFNEASRIMHEMNPATYPAADSWARTLQNIDIDTDPNRFADRVFDLMARRRDGKTIIFVIDEVGQYVARSTDKMLDLQGVIQALGAKGRGKAWVAVTSQERLEEIVSSLDQSRIELARLRDRFPLRVDLVASDIAEVTSARVLAKKPEVAQALEAIYDGVKGQLSTFTRLEGTARFPGLSPHAFALFYPFVPYQIDLIIDIIAGLRLQAGGSTHTGGSSRTIIKLAQQVIVDDQVGLGDQPVGPLVTLDQIYDLIQQFVSPERRADLERIERNFTAEEYPLVAKAAKVICLLEQVKNVRRSSETLAAVLHPAVDSPSLVPAVEAALAVLKENQWVEEGEQGWQLLSPQGKQWATERHSLPDPKDYHNKRNLKELLEELLKSAKDYRHKNHRTFRPAVQFQTEALTSGGDIPVDLTLVTEQEWEAARKEAQERSRESKSVLFIAPVTAALYKELEEIHRSQEMIGKYKRDAKERGFLQQIEAENRRLGIHQTNAKNRLTDSLMAGDTYFGGLRREASGLSDQLSEVLQRLFSQIVPELYPKFELAALPVKEAEILRIIEDTNLGSLPEVYLSGQKGLGLVVKDGGMVKPNTSAPVVAEVLAYIERNHRPPERVTGKAILERFRGLGYGWDDEPVRMATAVLLRAGLLEITANGQRIQSHADFGAREVFKALSNFRAASFAPKSGGITPDEIILAFQLALELWGEAFEPIEATVVAEGVKGIKGQVQTQVHTVQTNLLQADLPGRQKLDDYLKTLENVVKNATDDLIKAFLAEEAVLREGQALAQKLGGVLNNTTISEIKQARAVWKLTWPILKERLEGEALAAAADRLDGNLHAERWFEALPAIKTDRKALADAYLKLYEQVFTRRTQVYAAAIEDVKGHPKWPDLKEIEQKNVLFPLQGRVGEAGGWSDQKLPQSPTVLELESHLEGVDKLKSRAVYDIERLTTSVAQKIERIKVARYVNGAVESTEALNDALERLKADCAKLLATGAKVILE